jgi:hypothetical protein
MARQPRPSVVEKIQARQAATALDAGDLHNVLVVARLGIANLPGPQLAAAAASIDRLERVLAEQNARQQAADEIAAKQAAAPKTATGPTLVPDAPKAASAAAALVTTAPTPKAPPCSRFSSTAKRPTAPAAPIAPH